MLLAPFDRPLVIILLCHFVTSVLHCFRNITILQRTPYMMTNERFFSINMTFYIISMYAFWFLRKICYVFWGLGVTKISNIWSDLRGSFKVTDISNIEYAAYDLLLVRCCNYVSIPCRFRDIVTYLYENEKESRNLEDSNFQPRKMPYILAKMCLRRNRKAWL